MADTLGSLIDKICIAELKIYHTQKKADSPDAPADLKELCRQRLTILTTQRNDLSTELNGLIEALRKGTWKPKVYRQFKMYNDPRFQIKQKVS